MGTGQEVEARGWGHGENHLSLTATVFQLSFDLSLS